MSTSTGVFRTGDNLDSQIAESPSVVRPRSSDGEATVMEAGAGRFNVFCLFIYYLCGLHMLINNAVDITSVW
jgi:hypothetical protein